MYLWLMFFLYQVLIQLAGWIIPLAAPFNRRLQAWWHGRSRPITNKLPGPPVWFHCASLGEFEQARPLIEVIKARTAKPILLTFFSPSGYIVRKDYTYADQVEYLPLDTSRNASTWLTIFNPSLLILVKYDFWYNHLRACQRRGIPIMLISGTFRPDHYFFRWYGLPFRRIIGGFEHCFVQDEQSAALLQGAGVSRVTRVGDTRVDRVLHLPQEDRRLILIEEFSGAHPVWIWGSTWPDDEALFFQLAPELLLAGWKVILAPHDISEQHLRTIEELSSVPLTRLSRFSHGQNASALLVDNIGLLAYLYRYARLVYIGGGFGRNIHNVLEPMAFAAPVIFGPKYHQFREAVYLVETGAGKSVSDGLSLKQAWQFYQSEAHYREAQLNIRRYLDENGGATTRIYTYLAPRLT